MQIEERLPRFVCELRVVDVPESAQHVMRRMVMAVVGTGIAGAGEDGIAALRELLREAGGTPQATTLVFGDRLPAHAAAQLNGTMCRALDYCDAMAPGPHMARRCSRRRWPRRSSPGVARAPISWRRWRRAPSSARVST